MLSVVFYLHELRLKVQIKVIYTSNYFILNLKITLAYADVILLKVYVVFA